MKKLLKNKRGIAIESAILFMIIVFSFGFLLTGVAMTAHLRVKLNDSLLSREMEIEQIGENFVSMSETDFQTYLAGKNYTHTLGENSETKIKTFTLKRNNSVVLYIEYTIEYTEENSQKNVKVWKYTDKKEINYG